MSVYKIRPDIINQLREKYPQIELIFLVHGEVSYRKYETKANALRARYNNRVYLISFNYDEDGLRWYEVTETGTIMPKILGRYNTEVGAVMRILDTTWAIRYKKSVDTYYREKREEKRS